METKVCTKCKLEKSINDFWNSKNGKKRSRCKICTRIDNKNWEIKNKEKFKKIRTDYYLKHKEYYNNYSKQWAKNNPDKIKIIQERHRNTPKRKLYEKEYEKKYAKKRYKQRKLRFETHPNALWTLKIRRLARNVLRNKRNWYIMEFGCYKTEFIKHIESTWKPGMNWENYGTHGWHIDHIKALSTFNLELVTDRYKAAHYTNCQALWAIDNLKKGQK